MANIGLGLLAADEYFKEGDRREGRDYQRQLRQAELSALDDKVAATKSGYRDVIGSNDARARLRPQQTANQEARMVIEAVDIEGQRTRQPLEQETKALQTGLDYAQAVHNQGTLAGKQAIEQNKITVEKELSGLNVEQLPQIMAQKRREGVINDHQAGMIVLSKLSDLIKMGDPNQVVSFMNAMNEITPPEKRRAPVAVVGLEQDPNTGERMFVAKDAAGNDVVRMSQTQMARVRATTGADGKPDLMKVDAGDTVIDKRTGKPVYTAPESAKNQQAKMGPLERDVGYLINAHGMSKDQALAHLNSAKTMSREQFILKSMQDKIAMGSTPTEKDAQDMGVLYDRARSQTSTGAQPPALSGQTNTAQPATLNPAIKSIIGIQ